MFLVWLTFVRKIGIIGCIYLYPNILCHPMKLFPKFGRERSKNIHVIDDQSWPYHCILVVCSVFTTSSYCQPLEHAQMLNFGHGDIFLLPVPL